jgi:hypothetical protein
MDTSDEILAANDAFYAAFSAGNVEGMDDAWARVAPVSCVHPGWPCITERDTLIKSWEAILDDPPQVRFATDTVQMHGDVALVIGIEFIEDVMLATTNIFVREESGWKLAHHQSTPLAPDIEVVESGSESVH